MARRGWILVLGTGLCSGLLPACSHPASARRLDAAAVREPEAAVAADAAHSPYHQTVALRLPQDTAGDDAVNQAAYPPPPVSPAAVGAELPASVRAELPAVRGPEGEQSTGGAPSPNAGAAPAPACAAQDPPLIAALRSFLDKHPAEAVRQLERYDKANQDLLLCLLPLAARLTEGNLADASPQEMTNLVNHLEGALPPLRARAELVLERMCFCAWIVGYGRYEPLPEGHAFRVGEPVQVYVELQNVSSQLRGDAYVTQLASSVVIRDAAQRIVWRHDFGDRDYRDLSLTLRHDYFNNCRFCVPDIPPGQYTLCIQVEDVPTHRVARRALDFRVTTVPAREL
jgi:hypothetical protein